MFVKGKDDLVGGITYLENLLKSATEIKKFLDALKNKFELSNDSSVWDIYGRIEFIFDDWIKISSELDDLKEDTRYSQAAFSSLLAELAEKELSANVSSYIVYEIQTAITQLINTKKQFDNEQDYFSYVMLVLTKLVNADALQKKDTLSTQAKEISRLKDSLSKKIEDFERLRIKIAEMFSDACAPDLSTFDRDFGHFVKTQQELREKAAKYDFLLHRGVIKEVGNTISSNNGFHLSYGK